MMNELELLHGRLERYRGDTTCLVRMVLIFLAGFQFRWGSRGGGG